MRDNSNGGKNYLYWRKLQDEKSNLQGKNDELNGGDREERLSTEDFYISIPIVPFELKPCEWGETYINSLGAKPCK